MKDNFYLYRQGSKLQQVMSISPTKLRREASPLGRRKTSACGTMLIERVFFFEEKFEQWRYNINALTGNML